MAIQGDRRFELAFEIGPNDPVLGAPLRIALRPDIDTIAIYYTTAPAASALQWVDPNGTAGGKKPFLYSQSQAIHARSWIPCQDSPGVRVTYEAEIHAPEDLTAVMSAESVGSEGQRPQRFAMNAADPAVSDRSGRRRAGVPGDSDRGPESGPSRPSWTPPRPSSPTPRRCSRPPSDCSAPIAGGATTSSSCHPSFPFGGMENARLTFATPDGARRRPVARLADRPRAGAFLVGQPRDLRDLARLLAQRGVHHLPGAPDRRGAVRRRAGRDGGGAREAGTLRGNSASLDDRDESSTWT